MELRHLRYFQAVAEELSFSKPRRLNIAQPALSRAVQEIERDGVNLIDRNRRSVPADPGGHGVVAGDRAIAGSVGGTLRRGAGRRRAKKGSCAWLHRTTHQTVSRSHPRNIAVLSGRVWCIWRNAPERVWEMVAKGRLSIWPRAPCWRTKRRVAIIAIAPERLCAALPPGHGLCGRASISWRSARAGSPLVMLARREGAGSHDAEAGRVPGGEVYAASQSHAQSPSVRCCQYVEAGAVSHHP